MENDYRTATAANTRAQPYTATTGGYRTNSMSVEELLSFEHQPKQLIVKFKPIVSAEMVNRVHSVIGSRTLKQFKLSGASLIEVPDSVNLASALEHYRDYAKYVDYVEPNYMAKFDETVPNDPSFPQLWGMKNTGQTGGIPGVDINVTSLWDKGTGSDKVIVALVDSGVDYTHPDLAANMWVNTGEIPGNGIDDDGNGYIDDVYGIDAYNGNGNPMDDLGHGTHCAGTIGAVGNNGVGVAGVNWNVKIMALKCGDTSGVSIAAAIECLEYALANGATLTSKAGGTDTVRPCTTPSEMPDAGMLFVAAAGNNGWDNDQIPIYPASYDLDIIRSVNITANDTLAGSSNWVTC